jgi:hypothetical protein
MREGWIEFDPVAEPAGVHTRRTPRETTQPNRVDTEYWATGLTPVYLEGALARALSAPVTAGERVAAPVFDGPAPHESPVRVSEPGRSPAILDPFSVFEKGESLLRKELGALSGWHLLNIINQYELFDGDVTVLDHQPRAALVEVIVGAVRARS